MIDGFISRRLSSKLLLLTIGFVMLAELVIFVPSAALFRQDWFSEREQQAGLLAQALTGVPNYEASEVLREQFMADTDVMLMAAKRGGMTELVLGDPPESVQNIIEIDLREKRRFLMRYLNNIFWLSLLIAIITGTLIYLSMSAMIIRPVKRLAEDMTTFRDDPDRRGALRKHPKRKDEIGQLEREFIDLKQSQRAAFRQRERLASLGLAVAKINHDLRNVLSSALLISDRLSMNPEPKLSDMGERLTRSVERGIGMTEEIMQLMSSHNSLIPNSAIWCRRIYWFKLIQITPTAFSTISSAMQPKPWLCIARKIAACKSVQR